MPNHILVRVRDDGRTAIAFHAIEAVLRRAGVPDALAARLSPAQQLLVDCGDSMSEP